MSSREKWNVAAAAVVGRDVQEAVPMVRRRPGGGWWMLAGATAFAVAVSLHAAGVVPGPTLVAYAPGALVMSLLFQMANDPVFVVLTDTGLEVTGSTRWSPTPAAPALGPLDPAVVSGPAGLLRNSYDIGGVRHQVGWQHRGRFERLIAAARTQPATR